MLRCYKDPFIKILLDIVHFISKEDIGWRKNYMHWSRSYCFASKQEYLMPYRRVIVYHLIDFIENHIMQASTKMDVLELVKVVELGETEITKGIWIQKINSFQRKLTNNYWLYAIKINKKIKLGIWKDILTFLYKSFWLHL